MKFHDSDHMKAISWDEVGVANVLVAWFAYLPKKMLITNGHKHQSVFHIIFYIIFHIIF